MPLFGNNPKIPDFSKNHQKTQKMPLLIISELQRKCKKNAEIFGHIKKKLYLCTRF